MSRTADHPHKYAWLRDFFGRCIDISGVKSDKGGLFFRGRERPCRRLLFLLLKTELHTIINRLKTRTNICKAEDSWSEGYSSHIHHSVSQGIIALEYGNERDKDRCSSQFHSLSSNLSAPSVVESVMANDRHCRAVPSRLGALGLGRPVAVSVPNHFTDRYLCLICFRSCQVISNHAVFPRIR